MKEDKGLKFDKQKTMNGSCTSCSSTKLYCRHMCRSCYERMLRTNNVEYAKRQKENCKKWGLKNKDKPRVIQERRKTDPFLRSRDKKTKYIKSLNNIGLTEQGALLLITHQENKCAICGRSFLNVTRHLDHDHTTRVARGYLCSRCNNGLGMFEESKKMLEKAIQYLDNPSAKIFITEKEACYGTN